MTYRPCISTFPGLLLVIAVLTLLACNDDDREDTFPREPSGQFHMIPELLTDSDQPLLLAVDRTDPELLAFATERIDNDLDLRWNITSLGDGFYQILNSGMPQGEAFALSIVDDGVYDQVVMSEVTDFSGQQWQFTLLENGYCRLTTELLGLDIALTVVNDTPLSRLTMESVSNDPGQHWRLDYSAVHGILNDLSLRMCDDDLSAPFN